MSALDLVPDALAEMLENLATRLDRGQDLSTALTAAFADAGLDPPPKSQIESADVDRPSRALVDRLAPDVMLHLVRHEQMGEVVGGLRYAAAVQRATTRSVLGMDRG